MHVPLYQVVSSFQICILRDNILISVTNHAAIFSKKLNKVCMWVHRSELSALTTAAIFHAVTVQLEAMWISESIVPCWQRIYSPYVSPDFGYPTRCISPLILIN